METRFLAVDTVCHFCRQPTILSYSGMVVLALFVALPASAQTNAGSLLNQNQHSRPALPERVPTTENPVAPPASKSDGSVRVTLKSIRFSGELALVSEAELQSLVADVIGHELGFSDLEALVQRITGFLHSRGWLLAEAYLPRQDVTDGAIEITIRGGYLDGRDSKGLPYSVRESDQHPLRIDHSRLDGIAGETLRPGGALHNDDLERAVLLMNDLPGVSARARLVPGETPGSTQVLFDAEEGARLSGSLSADNSGNRDSGISQGNLAVQLNDPLTIGDQLAFSATRTEGLELGRLLYVVPFGNQGAKLGAAWTTMNYRVLTKTGRTADLEGEAKVIGLNLSYPWVRSRNRNVYGLVGYNRKVLKDDSIAGTLRDRRVEILNAGLSGDWLDGMGDALNSWSATLFSGCLNLDKNAADRTADALAYQTQGNFHKLTYTASRLQRLRAGFSALVNVIGQTSGKNLDSSEKFILGGPSGIRAYPVGEASGDSGWLASLELRYDLSAATSFGRLQLFGFFDTGRITLHRDSNGIPLASQTGRNSYQLSGSGLGVRIANRGSSAISVSWARKVGDNPGRSYSGFDADGRADKSRVWLQATLWY